MNNYTKGEWDIHNQDFRGGDELLIHPQVSMDGSYPFYCKVGGREKVANAQLIASAPQLYEALKALTKEFTKQTEVEANAYNALAKAEGK